MAQEPLKQIPARTAGEVCKRMELSPSCKQLLRDDLTPEAFLQVLLSNKQYVDAVRFLAHALPKRPAIWWALACAREAAGPNPPLPVAAALRAAESWIRDPSEANRRAAQSAAQAAELRTPAGCAALAVFFSGGSLGPPEAPVVPPAEYLTAHAVAGAVQLAAVINDPQHAEQNYGRLVQYGIQAATSPEPWKTAPSV